MKKEHQRYAALPFPKNRRLMADGSQIARNKHTVHGLVEFDITHPRAVLRRHREQTGETVSFTA